jgi:CheY-like chemotaxis protein
LQRLTQKTTGFAHADWRETRKNDKVSVGYEVDIRRLGVMDKITIAIADDQEITVEMLSNIVASQDDFVLAGTAGNGEEALDLVRRCKPQILLLDMIMPLVDGKEVMRQLQSDETISPDTKVIVVTAADRRALAEEMAHSILNREDMEIIVSGERGERTDLVVLGDAKGISYQ